MLNYAFAQSPSLQIQEALIRLATFCSLHGAELFKQVLLVEILASSYFLLSLDRRVFVICNLKYLLSFIRSGIAWIEFLNNTDILGDILTHLREGDIKDAQLLWLRYEVQHNDQQHTLLLPDFPDTEIHSRPLRSRDTVASRRHRL